MPRIRFTVRSLMIAVAVVDAAADWAADRRGRFHERALARKAAYRNSLRTDARGQPYHYHVTDPDSLGEWHFRMLQKFEHAIRYPWLPVEPDSTKPKD